MRISVEPPSFLWSSLVTIGGIILLAYCWIGGIFYLADLYQKHGDDPVMHEFGVVWWASGSSALILFGLLVFLDLFLWARRVFRWHASQKRVNDLMQEVAFLRRECKHLRARSGGHQ